MKRWPPFLLLFFTTMPCNFGQNLRKFGMYISHNYKNKGARAKQSRLSLHNSKAKSGITQPTV
jgi:hypothetical protein